LNSSAEASAAAARDRRVDRYLQVDGARLRYRDAGHGPAVVLVHGWTLDLEVWDSQVEALRAAFRIIRFDRRGFGLSSGRPSIQHDVHDLGALCRHLGLGRVALLGMSQGCRAVLGHACAHPGQVSCMVLDGPPEFDPSMADSNVSLAPFRELVRTQGLAAFREQWMHHPLMQLRTGDPATHARLQRMLERYPGNDLSDGAEDALPPDLSACLDCLAVPTLVITGEYDLTGRPRSADALARRMPAGERAVIAGSGHLASLDNPDAYNRLLAAFLTRHTGTPS
jgi:pimeloyl-ACP methyl ester carboxylesterase